MTLNEIFEKLFSRFALFFIASTIIIGAIFVYNVVYGQIQTDYLRMLDKFNAEKSYLTYNYLNDINSPYSQKVIQKINKESDYLFLSTNDHPALLERMMSLYPLKLEFGGKHLKTFYPAIKTVGLQYYTYFVALLFFGVITYLVFRYLVHNNKRHVEKNIVQPIQDLNSYFNHKMEKQNLESFPNPDNTNITELRNCLATVKGKLVELFESREKIVELTRQAAIGSVASQVAHDIRSPLAALDVACAVTHELPEDKRILIRQAVSRIRDIANNLVHKSRLTGVKDSAVRHDQKETEGFEICLLPSLVDELITEKRLQYRVNMDIEILADLDKKSYGLFAKIQPVEFKRVLSNLINNAVEAQGDKGQIIVSLNDVGANPRIRPSVGAGSKPVDAVGARSPRPGEGTAPLQKNHDDNLVMIQIKDNGHGIPPEILPKLMQRGASFGKEKEKESGSGLGLYHAKTTLQSWGGDLKIASKCVGTGSPRSGLGNPTPTISGTTVTLFLPKETPPAWFVPRLTLLPHVHLAILDDDVSIHQIWDGRLEEMGFEKEKIHHFSDPSALRKWFQQLKDKKDIIYLFDYELIGQTQTGLDLIEELGIARQSILVTSRYEEPEVLKQCQKQGVKVIPKPMAGFVPIERRAFLNPDCILIDDDESLRISWKLMAKAMHKILKVYESVEAFFKEAAQFDKTTPIYIDSHLGEGIKGEEVSKSIFEMGFTNIYLATGYNPNDFGDLPWIKGIVGKSPPW